MKITYAYFQGFIGFYQGMGLEELTLDLSKSQHPIILIVGKNGCGKSTLQSALNIFPDDSSRLIPGKFACKKLHILDRENFYIILITYSVDSSGNRKTTKAFIQRNGTELNENGNVTSYKDILCTEFDLDPNFVALSMLSSVDRGLGDKRPADRKKFVASVIDNLATYNDIFKTINKKSLIYKSHVNTIYTKIQSTGDKLALQSALSQEQAKEAMLNNNIKDLNDEIVRIQTKDFLDTEEANEFQRLNTEYDSVMDKLTAMFAPLKRHYQLTKVPQEEIEETLQKHKDNLAKHETLYEKSRTEWISLNDQLTQTSSTIQSLEVSISEAEKGLDTKIIKEYDASNYRLSNIVLTLGSLGVDTHGLEKEIDEDITMMTDLVNLCKKFVEKLDLFYDNFGDTSDVSRLIEMNRFPEIIVNRIADRAKAQQALEREKVIQAELNTKLEILSKLELRPSSCKINDCPFIQDAIGLTEEEETVETINSQIDTSKAREAVAMHNLTEIDDDIDFYNNTSSKRVLYEALTTLISDFESQYKENELLPDCLRNYEKYIIDLYSFNEIRNPEEYILIMNTLIQYRDELNCNNLLKVTYDAHKDKEHILQSSKETITKLEKEKIEIGEKIQAAKMEMTRTKAVMDEITNLILTLSDYKNDYDKFKTFDAESGELFKKLEKYKEKNEKSITAMNRIQSLKNEIDELKVELQPMQASIIDISGRLTLLDSYYQEYEKYNSSYQIIEVLKKYCSPTKGGIQTVFMQLYMQKTLDIANQILGMLFHGEYRLLDFIINENEFRIPFLGNGLTVDDISSGSNSQICMMGMVINLALLHQASIKYNIAYLDEIDAGLDHYNRFEFVKALYNTIPLLGIEQLFMISHSMEMDASSVDVIKLKGYDDFEDMVQSGNIIFDYNQL